MADPNDAPRPDARDDLERVLATTTPSQRLAWLDEMLDLAHAAGALDKARRLEGEERRTCPTAVTEAARSREGPCGDR